jgi:hypothetical protein
VSDRALELLQQMASDMNKSKRPSFPMSPLLNENAEIVLQATSWQKIFEVGSLHLIHGKTRMRSANCGTLGLRRGFSMAKRSRIGNRPSRVIFFRSVENVRCCPFDSYASADGFSPFVAGAGKSVLWYVNFSIFLSPRTYGVDQLRNHPGHRRHAEISACNPHLFLL